MTGKMQVVSGVILGLRGSLKIRARFEPIQKKGTTSKRF
jgi:hypothetical protein